MAACAWRGFKVRQKTSENHPTIGWWQCDNYNLKWHKYVSITTYQPETVSNPNPNPNPHLLFYRVAKKSKPLSRIIIKPR